jgi:hypothetical protein
MIHCQWEKGKYQNRFHVGEEWNTMSVNHGLEPIRDKKYINYGADWVKITSRYQKLKVFDRLISNLLWLTNAAIIGTAARDILSIKTKIVYDYPTDLLGTERLLDICKYYGATEYLSGKSGRNYLDLKQFDEAGIKVSFQDNPDLTPLVHLI